MCLNLHHGELTMITKDRVNLILKKARNIFIDPKPLYHYNDIVSGVRVISNYGLSKIMKAVDINSFIHYRFNKESNLILNIYQTYLNSNKDFIINKLTSIKNNAELDQFEDQIRDKIIREYNKINFNTKTNIFSYNRVRKIIDLYIEHVVSMAVELKYNR